MTTISTTDLGQLLKELYAPFEIEELSNLTYPVLGTAFTEGSAELGGAGFHFGVRVEPNVGHAYIGESDDLPAGRSSTVRQTTVSPTVHVGVVELTGLSRAVSSGNPMAFARAFDENVQSMLEEMSAYKEGVVFRDGTGALATFDGDPDADAGPHVMSDVGFFREGMYVDIIDTADDTRHETDAKITGVDWVNKTITFSAAIDTGVDDLDIVYLADSQDASGAEEVKEPVGLEGALLTSGTYLNIDRGDYPNWQANVFAASALFDEDILLRARTRLTQESGIRLSGMGSRFKVICHPMQADILFKLAIPRVQYAGTSSIDLGNASEVSFGGIQFVTSYQCPTTVAYLGDWKYAQAFYTPGGKLHIDTEYNGSGLKWLDRKDAGLVFAKEYCAFAVRRPNAFVRITGLTEATR